MTETNRLREILQLVEDSLDEPRLAGSDLARRAYLSRFHFDRLVHATLGEPTGRFRRRLLLERAAYRLARGNDTVIDVAAEAGYESPDAFTRAFVRAYGCTPSAARRGGPPGPRRDFRLPTPSSIHFHPPGGLRLPAPERSDAMDVLTKMYEHHVWLTGQIVDRLDGVDDTALDRSIGLDVEGIDEAPSLRVLTDRLVRQLEMWAAAVEGAEEIPVGGTSVGQLRERLDDAEPRFRAAVVEPVRNGHADDAFVDATCMPPQTFSLGGVLAHVLTFSAVRRTLAVGALATAGVDDLGSGDPMGHVGGTGDDASTISRTFVERR
ncbi:helix-turn-helix transcriptional regulator [Cellulomonas sp. JH27-2]|uniref:helix-turn-helix domain-containing protein n=1 Tax=Cellulomonas sp. JH27-2 TaxID=2774139 RepID=UPI00177EBD16|nr:AraC family transcriptional regulator [Cellulomonas sp. JH27-2]MBD8060188.1 helix-turn-helix transcriptional regulator [Cellulomonas sp. JH27-2]